MRHKGKLFVLFIVSSAVFGLGIFWIENLDKIKVVPSTQAKELLERIRRYQFYGNWEDASGGIANSFQSLQSKKGRAWLDVQKGNSYGGLLVRQKKDYDLEPYKISMYLEDS